MNVRAGECSLPMQWPFDDFLSIHPALYYTARFGKLTHDESGEHSLSVSFPELKVEHTAERTEEVLISGNSSRTIIISPWSLRASEREARVLALPPLALARSPPPPGDKDGQLVEGSRDRSPRLHSGGRIVKMRTTPQTSCLDAVRKLCRR